MNSEELITDLKQFIAATVSQSATELRQELIAEMDKRFDEQERCLSERFDKRFDEIGMRLNKRMDEIDDRLDAILNCLGEYVEECDAKFALHGKTIKQHGVRLKRLEMKAA